jgi:hypothetical protein
LVVAAGAHLHAAAVALSGVAWIPAWHWAMLALAETGLLAVALARPRWFTLRDFRLPGVFVVTTGAFILIPLPWIVRRYDSQVPSTMVLAIALGLMALGAVVAIGSSIPPRPARPAPRVSEPLLPALIAITGIVLFPLWLRSLGSIPILDLLRGTSAIDAALARDAALAKLASAPLRIAVATLRNLYLTFAVAWTVAAAVSSPRRDRRARRLWWAAAGLTLAVSALYAVVTTERSVLGQVVVAAIVAGVIARGRGLHLKEVVIGVAAVSAFPILFGLRAGVGGLGATLTGLGRRAFVVPGDVMIRYFVEFPRFTPHLEGASIPKLARLTGGSTFDLSEHIYVRYFQFDRRLVGNANASFLGVGWANGGMVGVIVWCVAVGAALVWIERLLRDLGPRAGAAIRAIAVIQTALLTSADITRTLVGFAPGFLDLIVMVYVLRWIDRRRAVRSPSRQPAPSGRRISRPARI